MHTLQHVLGNRSVVHAAPDASALDAARQMVAARVGALVVLDGPQLIGIFSERDLMSRVVALGRDPATTPLSLVMTREVVTARLSDRVDACEEKMRRAGCRHLPVLESQRVVAMLSMRDLLRDEIAQHEAENRELRAYLHQTPAIGAAPSRG